MKKLFLFVLLLFSVGMSAQIIRDTHCIMVGAITPEGKILNAMNKEIGTINADGMIINQKKETAGYITEDGKILDSAGQMIGFVKPDGRVVNTKNITLGYLKTDGKVMDNAERILGVIDKKAPLYWGAIYFFFS